MCMDHQTHRSIILTISLTNKDLLKVEDIINKDLPKVDIINKDLLNKDTTNKALLRVINNNNNQCMFNNPKRKMMDVVEDVVDVVEPVVPGAVGL